MKLSFEVMVTPVAPGAPVKWTIDGNDPDFEIPADFATVQRIPRNPQTSKMYSDFMLDNDFVLVPNAANKNFMFGNDFGAALEAVKSGNGDLIFDGGNGVYYVAEFVDRVWGETVRSKVIDSYNNTRTVVGLKVGESILTIANAIAPSNSVNATEVMTFDTKETAEAFAAKLVEYLKERGTKIIENLTKTEHLQIAQPLLIPNRGPVTTYLMNAAVSFAANELYPEIYVLGYDSVRPMELAVLPDGPQPEVVVTADKIDETIEGLKTFDIIDYNRQLMEKQRAAQEARMKEQLKAMEEADEAPDENPTPVEGDAIKQVK